MILPEPRSQHRPQKELGQISKRGDVELDLACTLFQRDLGEFSELAIARVVDQDIHGNPCALQFLEQRLRGGRGSEVEGHRPDRDAELALQFVANLLQPGPLRATSTRL